jgi:hypothetical protein
MGDGHGATPQRHVGDPAAASPVRRDGTVVHHRRRHVQARRASYAARFDGTVTGCGDSPSRIPRRIPQPQPPQPLHQHRRHHQVAVHLGVRRHHRPRRPARAGPAQGLVIGGLVSGPMPPDFQVGGVEFPALVRVVQARLQPAALLGAGHVQHELDDHGAGLRQHAFEVVDVPQPLANLGGRQQALRHVHDHVFAVAAVEDDDLAIGRHGLVDAPQRVVRALRGRRGAPADAAQRLRAHAPEDVAQRAVLAAGVQALQHHQQPKAAVGMEHVAQVGQALGQLVDLGLVRVVRAQAERRGAGVDGLQAEGRRGAGTAVGRRQ